MGGRRRGRQPRKLLIHIKRNQEAVGIESKVVLETLNLGIPLFQLNSGPQRFHSLTKAAEDQVS